MSLVWNTKYYLIVIPSKTGFENWITSLEQENQIKIAQILF